MAADSGRRTTDTVWRCEIRKHCQPNQFQARRRSPQASPTGRNDSARFSSIALISPPVRARQKGPEISLQTRLRLHLHVRRRAEAGKGRSVADGAARRPSLCPWRRRKVASSLDAIRFRKPSSSVNSDPSSCPDSVPSPLQRVDSAPPGSLAPGLCRLTAHVALARRLPEDMARFDNRSIAFAGGADVAVITAVASKRPKSSSLRKRSSSTRH
jgi:hypothetical protein